jgi:2-oxoglutarate decarboxylase
LQTVTFIAAFTIDVDAATKLTYPEGWSGPVDDDIAEAAEAEGCLPAKPKAEKPAKPKAEKPAKPKAEKPAAAPAAAPAAPDADAPPA